MHIHLNHNHVSVCLSHMSVCHTVTLCVVYMSITHLRQVLHMRCLSCECPQGGVGARTGGAGDMCVLMSVGGAILVRQGDRRARGGAPFLRYL